MSVRVLVSNAVWSAIAHLFERGSIIVASVVLSNYFDPQAFAAYSYFFLTVSMLSAYAALGMGVTASRFFAESNQLSEDEWPPVGALWCLSLVVGFAVALLVLFLPNYWISSHLNLSNWVLALGVLSLSLNIVPNSGILGLELYRTATLIAFVSATVLLVGVVVAGIMQSVTAAILFFVRSRIFQAVGNATVILSYLGPSRLMRQTRLGKKELSVIGGYAGPMLFVSLLAAGGPWLVGRIILAEPGGSMGFAAYAIGMQWLSLVLFIPGMVARVLLPRFVAQRIEQRNKAEDESNYMVLKSALLTVSAALIIASLGSIASPFLLQLYGSDIVLTPFLLATFMFAAVPSAFVNTIGNAIVVNDGQNIWLGATLCWFCCYIMAALQFASLGPIGGAYAYGVASLPLSFLVVIVAKKYGIR